MSPRLALRTCLALVVVAAWALLAPAPACAQPTAPWRLAEPPPTDAARMRGVLAQYAAQERAVRNAGLLVGLEAGAATIGVGLVAVTSPQSSSGALMSGAPIIAIGAMQGVIAGLMLMPGGVELARATFERGLRAGVPTGRLLALTEARLAMMAGLMGGLQQRLAPMSITAAVISGVLGAGLIAIGAVGANLWGDVPAVAYLGVPCLGLAAQLLMLHATFGTGDLARRALRDYRRQTW